MQNVVADFQVAFFGLLVQNGFAGFYIRRLDVDREAPGKAADQAVRQVLDFGSRCVRGQHNLLAGLVQGVKNQEEFVLGFVLAGPVLDVVNQQDIDFVAVEVGHFGDALFAQALHVLLRKIFRGQVAHALGRIFFENVVTDSLQKVSLAKARRTVNEERVVLRAVGVAGDCECCIERKLGLVTRHKIFKAERTRKRNARLQEIAEAVVACRGGLGYSFLLLEFKFNSGFVVGDFAPGEADEFFVSRIDGGIQSGRNGDDCVTGSKARELGLRKISLINRVRKHPTEVVQTSFPFGLHFFLFH